MAASDASKNKMLSYYLWIAIAALIIVVIGYLVFYQNAKSYNPGYVVVSSVSSNGNYVVTSNSNNALILWDIKSQTHHLISKDANPKSAYFIKHTSYFMYQNKGSYRVIIEDVNGKIIKTFPMKFLVSSQIITSNLKHYFASDANPNIYYGKTDGDVKLIPDYTSKYSPACHFEMHLAANDKTMVTSGFCQNNDKFHTTEIDFNFKKQSQHKLKMKDLACVTYWQVNDGKPLRAYFKDGGVTVSDISPDSKFVISGDQYGYHFVTPTAKGQENYVLNHSKNNRLGYLALKFIDNDSFITVSPGRNYAILESAIGKFAPKKLALGSMPYASINDLRYRSVSTSPFAHILVMGQQDGNGIIVFKYYPEHKTMRRIWSPII